MPNPFTDEQVNAAVDFLIESRNKGGLFDAIPETCEPQTLGDGLRISQRLTELLNPNRQPAGWKAGGSSPKALQDSSRDAPPSAPLYPEMILEHSAELSTAVYRHCVIEAEFAVVLGCDLPRRDTAYTIDEIREAIVNVHAAIEAPNIRFAAGRSIGMPSVVADGFAAETLVLGPSVENWHERDLTTIDIELLFDGEVVARGFEGNDRVDPVSVVHLMANDYSRRPNGLLNNQIITTGAVAPATTLTPGQSAAARFSEIGEVTVSLN